MAFKRKKKVESKSTFILTAVKLMEVTKSLSCWTLADPIGGCCIAPLLKSFLGHLFSRLVGYL